MKKIILSAVVFILGFVVSTLGFWVFGFDFAERGNTALAWYVLSLWFGVAFVVFSGVAFRG